MGRSPGTQFDPEAETAVPAASSTGQPGADAGPISGEEATVASMVRPTLAGPKLQRGHSIGRFIVVDRLGAGAMGEVVSAYDPDLHRRVAIKVLRVDGSGSTGDGATERMLREARAMAQLSHPNVITVFEVDRFGDGQLFIAMEFVDGGTLKDWGRRETGRTWRDVVRVYVQAGLGLAAAHAAGMVHRDFKPDNVLIGSDGRVRVTDFGLVGVDPSVETEIGVHDSLDPEQLASDASAGGASSAARAVLDVTLTRTGAIMGTPAYMSPEQGKAIDARSDQFSFCVALYEALYGERPFAGDTLADLRYNVMHARLRPEPRRHDVPAWLRTVVLRGLSVDPDERWPSMAELLEAIDRDPTMVRRQLAVGGTGVLALAGLVTWLVVAQPPEDDPCDGGPTKVAQVWDETRSDRLRDAFASVSPDQADAAHGALARTLDSFADDWATAFRDACEATRVRREQSDDLFDRRMRCLDRRLETVDALITVFEAPTTASIGKAESAGETLPSLSRCADPEALAAQIPPPEDPEQRETWNRLHRDLDRADALGVAGNEVASLALYEALTPEVERLSHPPLSARLHLNHGNALVRQQRWSEAIEVLDPGPSAAARSADATVEAQLWLLLAKANGFGLGKLEAAATMARAAEVAAVRAGDPAEVAIGIQYTQSLLQDAAGDFEAAVEYAQRSVELSRATHGDEHRTTSTLLGNLGSALDHAGRYGEAMKAHEESLRIDTAMHGPDHPDVGHSLINIGLLHQNQGQYDLAEEKFERALAIYEQTVGRKHGAYGTALLDLAQNSFYRLRFEEARDRLLSLLELYRQTRPEIHDDIAIVHQNLGSAYTHLEDLQKAETHYREAYRIREQVFGQEHPKVMHSINAMAQVLARKGEFASAEQELRRAVEIGQRALPEDHPDLAYPLQNLGNVLAEQERYEEALPFLERAVQLREDINPNLLGRSEFALGRVLWFVDRDAAQAMLAQAAQKMDELGKREVDLFLEMVK